MSYSIPLPEDDEYVPEAIYPEIEVQLTGTDGNAGALMGEVAQALRHHRVDPLDIQEFRVECLSGDYNHLLTTCMKWVTVS